MKAPEKTNPALTNVGRPRLSLCKPTGCLLPVGKVAKPLRIWVCSKKEATINALLRDRAGGCDRPRGAELSKGSTWIPLCSQLLWCPLNETVSVPWDYSCSQLLISQYESSKQILFFPQTSLRSDILEKGMLVGEKLYNLHLLLSVQTIYT